MVIILETLNFNENYKEINLINFLNDYKEENIKRILLNYKCPLNKDIEDFLHNKAINFCLQKLAMTYLIFNDSLNLIGFYTLANKVMRFNSKLLSLTLKKSISKYGEYDREKEEIILAIPLIAQLGKNYNNYNDRLISGSELLEMACNKVKEAQRITGGNYLYLECENTEKLLNFYTNNNFSIINKRIKDNNIDKELIQLIRKNK